MKKFLTNILVESRGFVLCGLLPVAAVVTAQSYFGERDGLYVIIGMMLTLVWYMIGMFLNEVYSIFTK